MHDGKAVLEWQQIDQQKLQDEIRGKQQDLMQLQEKFVASQMNNSRLQDRVTILQQQCEENQLLLQALQTELHVYEAMCPVPKQKVTTGQEDLVPIDSVNKQGIHVIGNFKDFCTLQKQILEGKNLIHRMALLLQPGLEPQSNKVFYIEVIKQLLTSASCLHQILEKSTTTLSMFWKAPLHETRISSQDQSMKIEIQLLRTKLAEQESHLQSTRDVKESMENFLLTHLTRTYDVLRKARTNLEGISQQPTPISAIM
ncbi:myomegalin-like [Anolis sagrei]|uniref:myomegalin-like n=1 Tax=Anolis sagrei TaxID=38937 RepID=UPI003520582B